MIRLCWDCTAAKGTFLPLLHQTRHPHDHAINCSIWKPTLAGEKRERLLFEGRRLSKKPEGCWGLWNEWTGNKQLGGWRGETTTSEAVGFSRWVSFEVPLAHWFALEREAGCAATPAALLSVLEGLYFRLALDLSHAGACVRVVLLEPVFHFIW